MHINKAHKPVRRVCGRRFNAKPTCFTDSAFVWKRTTVFEYIYNKCGYTILILNFKPFQKRE